MAAAPDPAAGRPRVLLVNHVSQMSGAEMSLLGLVEGLPDAGFAVEVALPPGGPLMKRLAAREIPRHAVAMTRLRRRTSALRQLWVMIRLAVSARLMARIIRQRGIALVHANSTVAAIPALMAARQAGVPGLWHVRDLLPLGFLGSHLGRQAARVIAISGAVAEEVAGAGVPRERIVVIPNGVNPEQFYPDAEAGARLRQELGIAAEAFVLVAASQIVPWKNLHVLLDALSRVRRAAPEADIHCLIAGADLFHDQFQYEALLRARAQQPDLAGAVTFLGQRDDMRAVFNAGDVCVLPSKREPFGRVLIEAMACGKPVIAGNEGGAAEIVIDGQTGLLAPPGDAEALARAITRLYQTPKLARSMAEAGRQRALSEYPMARTVSRMAALYREVLAGDARRR